MLLPDDGRQIAVERKHEPHDVTSRCCCWRAADCSAAFDALNRGLSLTRGYGFTRGVFDETQELTQLIKTAAEHRKLRCVMPGHCLRKFENVFAGGAPLVPATGVARNTAAPSSR